MNRRETDMESPDVKKNPFLLPEGYFDGIRGSVSDRISGSVARRNHKQRWPRIAYVAAVSCLFVAGYITIPRFFTDSPAPEAAEVYFIESGLLSTSFIDFFDEEMMEEMDAIDAEENIPEEEIVSYLSENATIMLLASLE